MFNFIKQALKKVYDGFTSKIGALFLRQLDDSFLNDLSALLIQADTGVKTTNDIINGLSVKIKDGSIQNAEQAKIALEEHLLTLLTSAQVQDLQPKVLLMVGINGSGKTTFVGKLAHRLKQQGKRVMVVAGDTFRAAATQQLQAWGTRVGVEVFVGKENQDPAAVIFDACKRYRDESFDHIIIDTAGRLQTKVNLMNELQKMRKIIDKQLPGATVHTWLTIDGMLGQNSLRQAELFHEATILSGVVLTKLDGTGKGGIVFSVVAQLGIPVTYVTFGEQLEDLKAFEAKQYVHDLLNA